MVNAMLFPFIPFIKTKTHFWETCIECNNANVFFFLCPSVKRLERACVAFVLYLYL